MGLGTGLGNMQIAAEITFGTICTHTTFTHTRRPTSLDAMRNWLTAKLAH